MILRIATHEFRYMFWSLPTLIAMAGLLGFSFYATINGPEFQLSVNGNNILINSPVMITIFMLMSSVVAIFFVPTYMATSVLKDTESQFDGILFSTPISREQYLGGRFLGAFAALMVVMSAGPLGMILGYFWPKAIADAFGPFNLVDYVVSYFGFLMPSMLFISALVFAVATFTRSMMFCYTAILGLFIFYIAGQGTINLAGQTSNLISPLWDPFMLATVEQAIAYWTAAELNTNRIAYSGTVLANRLIWLTIVAGLFVLAFKSFSFRKPSKTASLVSEATGENAALAPLLGLPRKRHAPVWNARTFARQFVTMCQFETKAMLKSKPFLILMGFSLFLLITSLSNRTVMYDVNAVPTTGLLMANIRESLVGALFAITAFYGADIVWRDRESGFSDLLDSAPAANWVFVASKLAALAGVIYAVILTGVLVAISIQIASGRNELELLLYIQQGFLFSTTFIFLAVLSVFLQVLVKNRFLGIALMGLFALLTLGSMGLLGFEHPLLRYAVGTVASPYSDMNGVGRFIEADLWIRAYYASLAGLLVLATFALWNRGTLQPLKYRLMKLTAFRRPSFLVPTCILLVAAVGSASFVFYNTNVLNDYRTSSQSLSMQVSYEKKYGRYADLPMPDVEAVWLKVDLFPDESRALIEGQMTLENRTAEDIHEVHLVFSSRLDEVSALGLEGATLTHEDSRLGYYILELTRPMLPGERRNLSYKAIIDNDGFKHRNHDVMLVRNGTFIDDRRIAPHIGFNPSARATDKRVRQNAGLEALPGAPALEDAYQHIDGVMEHVTFEATVSTSVDQFVVTSGNLEAEWIDGDRRYFRYKSNGTMLNRYGILSARYSVLQDQWNDVDLSIYYHKPHSRNLDRMVRSMKDSLDYFSSNFGEYQFDHLRIVEFPAYRDLARSYPGTIAFSENLGFNVQVRTGLDIDLPYYVTAHEVAHQWWAHQVTPGNTEGAAMLTESLSQYSALMVMEERFGRYRVRQFLKHELDSYLSGRNREADFEVPLNRVGAQEYIFYRKGAVALYGLRDYLGAEAINHALRRLVEERGIHGSGYPTTSDFVRYLKEATDAEHHELIEDFLEKITLYDTKLQHAEVEELEDGRFKVSLDIDLAKFYADGTGNVTRAAFDIPVSIGLFLKHPDAIDFSSTDVIMMEKKRVSGDTSTLEFIVSKRPSFAGVDPYRSLIDRDIGDNLMQIE